MGNESANNPRGHSAGREHAIQTGKPGPPDHANQHHPGSGSGPHWISNAAKANGQPSAQHGPGSFLMLRWFLGMVIILACGWGLFGLNLFIESKLRLGISWQVVAICTAVPSFGLFFLLEKKLWLNRFMGLPVTSRSSPLLETIFF